MAYNDEAIQAKLSTLNETQESIVTVAQWIMFNRRPGHADRVASLWLEKLKDSNSHKRLILIYLANELVQQSKGRKREDFLLAFSPVIPEATSVAYRAAHGDVRLKIKRNVEVWRQRGIFDETIQSAIEARITEIEKSASSGTKKLLGGSLLSGGSTLGPSSAPTELKNLVSFQENVNKTAMGLGSVAEKADEEYAKTKQSVTGLSPPVQVARYSALFKSLANAENAVAESVKARQDLLKELEKLVKSNGDALAKEQTQHAEMKERKAEIQAKKQEVEDTIMRNLATVPDENGDSGPSSNGADQDASNEPRRPQTEELTPPPIENITPVDSPEFQPADVSGEVPGIVDDENVAIDDKWNVPEAGAEWTEDSFVTGLHRGYGDSGIDGEESAAKRQRLDDQDNSTEYYSGGGSIPGLSSDVDDLIRSEGRR